MAPFSYYFCEYKDAIMSDPDISLIIPIYNEEGNLPELYKRLNDVMKQLKINYEYIFINDGSQDLSLAFILELASTDKHVKYINFSRNFGHQIAVTAGLDSARGNVVSIMDADLQDPPELITSMYEKLNEGYEVVYAKRKRRDQENLLKLVTAKIFYRILALMTSIDIPLDTGDFRVMDRKVVEVLRKMPEHRKFIRGQISWIGFNQTYVEFERAPRQAGKTGYTYRKMMRFALDGITSFSNFPLKFATIAGFVVSFIAFIIMLYALYSRLITKNYEPGWASLIICVLFIGGIQLLSVGIIGEYISRMNENLRNRPLYIIKDTNINFSSKEN